MFAPKWQLNFPKYTFVAPVHIRARGACICNILKGSRSRPSARASSFTREFIIRGYM